MQSAKTITENLISKQFLSSIERNAEKELTKQTQEIEREMAKVINMEKTIPQSSNPDQSSSQDFTDWQ